MKHTLLPLDILAIAMAGLCAAGLLAGAMGWVPSWLAAVLVVGSCVGLFGGLAAILYREGMPGRKTAAGIGAIVLGATLVAVVALLLAEMMWR